MIRWVEKKNWRSYIESCWTLADQVSQCVEKSSTYAAIKDEKLRSNLKYATGKDFISGYIRHWMNDGQVTDDYPHIIQQIKNGISLQDTNSALFDSNREVLEALNSECNFLALGECSRQTFTLENMEGDYNFFAQSLKK
jgi:hypothetical protein